MVGSLLTRCAEFYNRVRSTDLSRYRTVTAHVARIRPRDHEFVLQPRGYIERIKEILARYPNKMAACLAVYFGSPNRSLADGSDQRRCWTWLRTTLDLPPAHIHSVVTFYTMFNRKPVGKFHIQVCTNISCQLCGCPPRRWTPLKRNSGSGTGKQRKDGLFTLEEVECLAACGTAPAVQINDRYFEPDDG